jgi:hypothetical protein
MTGWELDRQIGDLVQAYVATMQPLEDAAKTYIEARDRLYDFHEPVRPAAGKRP